MTRNTAAAGTKAGIRLRPGRPGDVAAAIDVFQAAVHGLAARDYTPAQCHAWAPCTVERTAWCNRWAEHRVWVAVDDAGAEVGFAEAAAYGHIAMLYDDPAVARRGIASSLLAAAEAAARAGGVDGLFTEASLTARPFFQRHGFAVVAPETVARHGQFLRRFRMTKALHKGL